MEINIADVCTNMYICAVMCCIKKDAWYIVTQEQYTIRIWPIPPNRLLLKLYSDEQTRDLCFIYRLRAQLMLLLWTYTHRNSIEWARICIIQIDPLQSGCNSCIKKTLKLCFNIFIFRSINSYLDYKRRTQTLLVEGVIMQVSVIFFNK